MLLCRQPGKLGGAIQADHYWSARALHGPCADPHHPVPCHQRHPTCAAGRVNTCCNSDWQLAQAETQALGLDHGYLPREQTCIIEVRPISQQACLHEQLCHSYMYLHPNASNMTLTSRLQHHQDLGDGRIHVIFLASCRCCWRT